MFSESHQELLMGHRILSGFVCGCPFLLASAQLPALCGCAAISLVPCVRVGFLLVPVFDISTVHLSIG